MEVHLKVQQSQVQGIREIEKANKVGPDILFMHKLLGLKERNVQKTMADEGQKYKTYM